MRYRSGWALAIVLAFALALAGAVGAAGRGSSNLTVSSNPSVSGEKTFVSIYVWNDGPNPSAGGWTHITGRVGSQSLTFTVLVPDLNPGEKFRIARIFSQSGAPFVF